MKKKIFTLLALFVVEFIICFLLGAFYETGFNIRDWHPDTRYAIVFTVVFVWFFSTAVYIPLIIEEKW